MLLEMIEGKIFLLDLTDITRQGQVMSRGVFQIFDIFCRQLIKPLRGIFAHVPA